MILFDKARKITVIVIKPLALLIKVVLNCFVDGNFGGDIENIVQFVHCSNVLFVIRLLQSIEQTVSGILGMTND